MFKKLTSTFDGKSVWINLDKISSMRVRDGETMLFTIRSDDEYFTVKETPAEILGLVGRAPLMRS